MIDKLLPAGTYSVIVQAIGGEVADGGVLTLMFAQPLPPGIVQVAVAKGIEILVPKSLDSLPSGAWWYVGIGYQSSVLTGCMLAAQEQLSEPLRSDRFREVLSDLAPRLAVQIAFAMSERIGVAPLAPSPPDPAERPALLN